MSSKFGVAVVALAVFGLSMAPTVAVGDEEPGDDRTVTEADMEASDGESDISEPADERGISRDGPSSITGRQVGWATLASTVSFGAGMAFFLHTYELNIFGDDSGSGGASFAPAVLGPAVAAPLAVSLTGLQSDYPHRFGTTMLGSALGAAVNLGATTALVAGGSDDAGVALFLTYPFATTIGAVLGYQLRTDDPEKYRERAVHDVGVSPMPVVDDSRDDVGTGFGISGRF